MFTRTLGGSSGSSRPVHDIDVPEGSEAAAGSGEVRQNLSKRACSKMAGAADTVFDVSDSETSETEDWPQGP
eukprot:13859864-Alexandrium_andersonii.AAC.1